MKSNRTLRLVSQTGKRQWLKLSAYAARLQRSSWQEVTWPSEQGGEKMYARLVQTWVCELGPILFMITCPDLDEPLKSVRYWGSSVLNLQAHARRKLQEQHCQNLLLWLKDQFQANSSIEQIAAKLALFNS